MAYCMKCGSEVSPSHSFCQRCGIPLNLPSVNNAPVTKATFDGGRLDKFLKWGGIGCGGFFAIFVMLAIIGALIGTEDENGTPTVKTVPDPTIAVGATAAESLTGNLTATPSQTQTAIPTPTQPPTATPIPTPTPTPVPIQVELVAFLGEYDQNKVRANARLRYQENGKVPVSTSGYVDEVEELYVALTPDPGRFWPIDLYCYFADTRAALQLTKGDRVSVTGRVSGTDGYSTRVHMFACEFEGIEFEKNPPVSVQALSHNVVQVFCTADSFFASGVRGTGIIVDLEEGTVLTVHHVIADENDCGDIEVQLQGSETRIPATSVTHCASIDRALLRVSPEDLSELSLQTIYRSTAPAQKDQEIYFWGYGTGNLRLEAGVVKDVLLRDVVTDAYAVPGDSGSPVFDEKGHLLGTMSRSNRSDRAVFTGDECK